MWSELNRLKSRVETVIGTLSNKAVNNEKMIEFKKQLVSNKSLKSYFSDHPDEKEIILNDISQVTNRTDRYLFKNLDVMPPYVIPENIIAQTSEQLALCTLGSASVIPGIVNQNRSLSNFSFEFVEMDHPSRVVQNLVGYPGAVQRYKLKQSGDNFEREDPTLLDHKALEPTSGRKLWKLKHNKRIHKPLKADKTGFIGGS